jgi:hypothetical protein
VGLVETMTLDHVPEEDMSLFAARFERIGESVTYMRWERDPNSTRQTSDVQR